MGSFTLPAEEPEVVIAVTVIPDDGGEPIVIPDVAHKLAANPAAMAAFNGPISEEMRTAATIRVYEQTIAGLREELADVTAERDANRIAVSILGNGVDVVGLDEKVRALTAEVGALRVMEETVRGVAASVPGMTRVLAAVDAARGPGAAPEMVLQGATAEQLTQELIRRGKGLLTPATTEQQGGE